MKLDIVQKVLEKIFYKYGMQVGKHPLPFLLIPILVALLSATGFIRLKFRNESEYLYSPTNGKGKDERAFFQKVFPENQEDYFSPSRKNTADGILNVLIAKSEEGGNVLSKDIIQHALEADEAIRKITIEYSGETFQYSTLCGQWNESCIPNIFLDILAYTPENVNRVNITYPFYEGIYLGDTLGGVQVDSEGYVIHAEAMIMSYFTRCLSEEDIEKGDIWLTAVKKHLIDHYTDEKVYFYTSITFDEELGQSYVSVMPRFAAAFIILLLFCILSTMSTDWVYSKPWVALASAVGALLATVTACGFLMACGWELFALVGLTPFVVIGKSQSCHTILSSRHLPTIN